MKLIPLSISIILTSLISTSIQAQTTQIRYRVKIKPKKHIIYRDSTSQQWGDTLTFHSGTVINYEKSYRDDKQTYTAYMSDTVRTGDTTIYTTKTKPYREPNLETARWANITVDESNASKLHINYWLSRDSLSNVDYYILLENRELVRFPFACIEVGALTIPFKYRPARTKNGVEISDEFSTNFNIGAYIGFTTGQITYMHRRFEKKKPIRRPISLGGFLTVSRVELDSSNTSSASEPLQVTRAIATVSPGFAIMTSIHGIRLGVFLGNDLAVGTTGRKWDYDDQWWWGFGFGYNIGFIWQPSNS